MASVNEWLGGEYKHNGVVRKITGSVKTWLAKTGADGTWTMDDVPAF